MCASQESTAVVCVSIPNYASGIDYAYGLVTGNEPEFSQADSSLWEAGPRGEVDPLSVEINFLVAVLEI